MKNIKNEHGKVVFRKFSDEENEVWRILSQRQLENLKESASKLREEGWELLPMDTSKVPDFAALSEKLKSLTGWEIGLALSQYEDTDTWARGLANKQMRITQFIREKKDLDYTPLPDMFHDAFGHIPFLAIPQYARISEKFGKAMVNAKTPEEQARIANHYWHTFELGLIKENGKIKALGTEIMSSSGELKHALSDNVDKLLYDVDAVDKFDRSAHEFHKQLFVLDNLDQIEKVVDQWL